MDKVEHIIGEEFGAQSSYANVLGVIGLWNTFSMMIVSKVADPLIPSTSVLIISFNRRLLKII